MIVRDSAVQSVFSNRDEGKRISGDLDVFDRESVYRGPISDLLNTAAEELANEPKERDQRPSHRRIIPASTGLFQR